jgi:FtsP/CotA-like multicopper oxidase with cupredoxin domain
MELAVVSAQAAVIAIDGIAVAPFQLESWLLGPAMRVDLVVRAPSEGRIAQIVDQRLPEVVSLARLVGTGPMGSPRSFEPLPLRASRIPEPDVAGAGRLTFVFAAEGNSKLATKARLPD